MKVFLKVSILTWPHSGLRLSANGETDLTDRRLEDVVDENRVWSNVITAAVVVAETNLLIAFVVVML